MTASLVGALSLGAAPVAAMADTGIDLQDVATDEETWNASTFKWGAEANEYGVYTVEPGDVFALESVTDVYGNAVSAGDYVVVYFDNAGNAVADTAAIDHQFGGMPSGAGTYTAAVVKIDGSAPVINSSTTLTGLDTAEVLHKQNFTVASEVKTLDGAFAFNGTTEKQVSDTTFSYTGKPIVFSFADADGNVLDSGDYTAQWLTDNPATVNGAGTYTALLTGKGDYKGSQATVSFTVNKLDLSKAKITIETTDKTKGLYFDASNADILDQTNTKIFADGEELAPGVLVAELLSRTNTDGTVWNDPGITGQKKNPGAYLFSITKDSAAGNNVTGQPVTVTAYVVEEQANVTYDEESIATYFASRVYETSKGEAFDPSLLAADVDGDEVPLKVTVTKDGKEVTSYTEPGEYVVNLEVATPANCAYGYKGSVKFTVVSKSINASKITVFASIDGKAANTSTGFSYTGEAMVPTVVVKEGKKVLSTDDYTVSYRIAGEKDTVDEMVEPGKYEIVVSFPGTGVADEIVNFEITKAAIQSVKPASPVYAYTGEAVKPDFVGYTGVNGGGTAVDFKNAEVGVTYYKQVQTGGTTTPSTADDTYGPDTSNPISASNLKDEGVYYAKVTVNTNNDHYTGGTGTGVTFETFQISKKAGFSDVSSSAWYASPVYKARELGYVNGIAGTNLFAPEADITRADAVCILFNMAGGDNALGDFQYSESTGWVTGFEDVDGHAYFAKALAWAHASGIANGYGDGTFAPYAQITREEFASMLANYAKSMGEFTAAGEGALDGMSDANTVSDWATGNVAWAVENGVMGNGGFVAGQSNITRAEVAAMAVNYQPEAL
ncbi:S-layer homology domain-containing protein [Collinsella tanakaei]|nr:S-layer homology domain-containing protein [Collinsella tanakaei]